MSQQQTQPEHVPGHVRVPTDTERFQELMDREPDATPSQIVAEALEFYAVSDKPWVALAEGRELGEVPAHE